jgi:hypothetical protein
MNAKEARRCLKLIERDFAVLGLDPRHWEEFLRSITPERWERYQVESEITETIRLASISGKRSAAGRRGGRKTQEKKGRKNRLTTFGGPNSSKTEAKSLEAKVKQNSKQSPS